MSACVLNFPPRRASFGSKRFALHEGEGRRGWSSPPKHNRSGQGFRKRVCNLTRPCVAETEERGKFLSGSTSVDKYARSSEESLTHCARRRRARMAGAGDATQSTMPFYYGGVERESIYHRTTFIHELSCGQVGSHLYSRMCCAGRSERSSPVGRGGGGSGRGSCATTGGAVNLFHSLFPQYNNLQSQNSGRERRHCFHPFFVGKDVQKPICMRRISFKLGFSFTPSCLHTLYIVDILYSVKMMRGCLFD